MRKPINTEAINDRPSPRISRSLADLETPGVEVELDPDEADRLGALEEDALSPEDAEASALDGPDRDGGGEAP